MQFIADKQDRLGWAERRDYRLEFADQMSHCCQQVLYNRYLCPSYFSTDLAFIYTNTLKIV